ncbi:MAG: MarR family winged helix-turn-helix transcriptional regulator [Vicinamibacteria bacterium]
MNATTIGNEISGGDIGRLRGLFTALVRRFSISERADVQCCGMTVAQAATLEALGREGTLRMGRLGRLLGITPSTLTRNLTRLEEGGLVRRSSDREDARASRVELTEKGRRVRVKLESIEDEFARRVLAHLAPEARERALAGLALLLEAVRAETESCCSGAFDHLVEGEASCCAPEPA